MANYDPKQWYPKSQGCPLWQGNIGSIMTTGKGFVSLYQLYSGCKPMRFLLKYFVLNDPKKSRYTWVKSVMWVCHHTYTKLP